MKEHQPLSRLGGFCSILVGISYLVIGVNYLLLPANLKAGIAPDLFLPAFAQNPFPLTLQYSLFAVGALLAMAAVMAISEVEVVRHANEGWVRWTSNLAFLGFAVIAIGNFRALALQAERAATYVAGDAATKAAIAATQDLVSLDPQGWLGFGAVGLWVLVISLLAIRGNIFPKPLDYVGTTVAVAYGLVVAGFVLNLQLLIAIAAGVGGVILGPIWYIWLGLILWRSAEPITRMAPSPT